MNSLEKKARQVHDYIRNNIVQQDGEAKVSEAHRNGQSEPADWAHQIIHFLHLINQKWKFRILPN